MFNSIYNDIAIVEAYINHRTGKQVRIRHPNLWAKNDFAKLHKLADFARKWFNYHNTEIITFYETHRDY